MAGLEDGSSSFLAAVAALQGFAAVRRAGGLAAADAHACALARCLAAELAALRHHNGARVAILYSGIGGAVSSCVCCVACADSSSAVLVGARGGAATGAATDAAAPAAACDGCWRASWGAVVAFNLLRPDGSWVGYNEVAQLAGLRGIALRTGCCCNPGATAIGGCFAVCMFGLRGNSISVHQAMKAILQAPAPRL